MQLKQFSMKKNILIYLIALIFISENTFAQTKTPSAKPRLIITIVVEGMRYDYLYRYWDKFSEGGFKKLISNGFLCKNAEYDYFYTQSASGYATISTGANPSQNGIIGNKWFDRLKNIEMYCVSDETVKPVGQYNDFEQNKVSPSNLLINSFSDELKLATFKQAKVFSVSSKDYAAVIPGGHLADGAFWTDKKTGNWISSSYYTETIPEWVSRFNEKKFTDVYLSKIWETYLPLNEYKESLGDNSSFEKGFMDKYKTFPYNLLSLKAEWGNNEILNYTPFGNTYTKDFAISAILNNFLGKDNICDYLNISYTANANIAKLFGIRSIELEDAYIRLDRDLQHFINFIEDYVGTENSIIILTSDKGDADSPEFLESIHMPSGYFKDANAEYLIGSYTRSIYKSNDIIQKFDANTIYLDRNKIEDLKLDLNEIQERIARFAVNFKGISNVLTSFDLESRNYSEGILKKVQNSYQQKRSGDLMLVYQAGILAQSNPELTTGYRNYTHVPLILYGWKIKTAENIATISITDLAPTLSEYLNISPPNASTGKIIENTLK